MCLFWLLYTNKTAEDLLYNALGIGLLFFSMFIVFLIGFLIIKKKTVQNSNFWILILYFTLGPLSGIKVYGLFELLKENKTIEIVQKSIKSDSETWLEYINNQSDDDILHQWQVKKEEESIYLVSYVDAEGCGYIIILRTSRDTVQKQIN